MSSFRSCLGNLVLGLVAVAGSACESDEATALAPPDAAADADLGGLTSMGKPCETGSVCCNGDIRGPFRCVDGVAYCQPGYMYFPDSHRFCNLPPYTADAGTDATPILDAANASDG